MLGSSEIKVPQSRGPLLGRQLGYHICLKEAQVVVDGIVKEKTRHTHGLALLFLSPFQ
jgi:hypothetical protein